MRNVWTKASVALSVAVMGLLGGSAEAQHVHGHHHHHNVPMVIQPQHVHTSHHHHDAAGHRIDDAGHHIDQAGHHTGNVGVYDNGMRSYPSLNTNGGYISNGVYYQYQTTPSIGGVSQPLMQNVVSQPFVQNVVPLQQPQIVQSGSVIQQTTYKPPQNTLPGTVVQANNTGGKIKILNPSDSGGEIRYSLNGTEYSIKPGYSQNLDNDRSWVINFGSGGTKGDVRYTLSAGTFKFKVTDAGWDLARAVEQPTISNALPPAPAPEPEPESPRPSAVAERR